MTHVKTLSRMAAVLLVLATACAVLMSISGQAYADTIQKTIKDDLDFAADSLNDAREQVNNYAMYIEIALGAIGAVSMLVASIGIANTMIMSVTERISVSTTSV